MDKNKVMEIVHRMCNFQSRSCRGLDMENMARELMNLAGIPQGATIWEIPLSEENQVEILFDFSEGVDRNYYSLFAGIGFDKPNEYLRLFITGKFPGTPSFYFLDKDIEIPLKRRWK